MVRTTGKTLGCGKTFSHQGKLFPSGSSFGGSFVLQRPGEFEAYQLIAGDRLDPCGAGADNAGGLGQGVVGFIHAGGNFE